MRISCFPRALVADSVFFSQNRLYILDEDEFTDSEFGGKSHFRDFVSDREPAVKITRAKRKSEFVGSKKRDLKKGQVLYLEAWHKNGGGPGHVKLGVVMPSGEWLNPVPSYFFSQKC